MKTLTVTSPTKINQDSASIVHNNASAVEKDASGLSSETTRSVRATLYHLDGEQSNIVLLVPKYTNWSEYLEEAQILINEYVNRLTRRFIKISRFETEIGYYTKDGVFNVIFGPMRKEIPLNKVYSSGKSGEWVNPEEHPYHPNQFSNTASKGGVSC